MRDLKERICNAELSADIGAQAREAVIVEENIALSLFTQIVYSSGVRQTKFLSLLLKGRYSIRDSNI